MSTHTIGFGPLKGPPVVSGARLPTGSTSMVYKETANVVTVDPNTAEIATLGVGTTAQSNGVGGFIISGTASEAMEMRCIIQRSENVSQSWVVSLRAGPNTVGIPFTVLGIPAGEAVWRLKARTSVGTFSIPTGHGRFWLEADAIIGGLVVVDPNQTVSEIPPQETQQPSAEPVTAVAQAPHWPVLADAPRQDVITVTIPGGGFVQQNSVPPLGSDDGWQSVGTTPETLTLDSPSLQAGNSGGERRKLFATFPLPYNLQGADIYQATLALMPDITANNLQLQVRAVKSGNAASPTTVAEFTALPLTTTTLIWDFNSVAGTILTPPDCTSLLEEIKATGVVMEKVTFVIEDRGSAADAFLVVRSKENGTGPPPTLTIGYAHRYRGGYHDAYAGGY